MSSDVTGPGSKIAPFTLLPFRGNQPLVWQPGRVTVFSFCALWCDTWKTQSARLLETQQAMAGLPLDFRTISVDGRWAERYSAGNSAGQVLLDTGGQLSATLGVRAVPYTFVVDRQGIVRFAGQGVIRSDELQATLRTVLAGGREVGGSVYLTFDDFPAPPDGTDREISADEALLDILRAASVRATFFCIGEHLMTPAGQSAALRAEREGHSLQIHSWSHDAANPQIPRCVAAMKGLSLASAPMLYRPPGSSALYRLDGSNVTPRRHVVNPYDYTRPGEAELLRRILYATTPDSVLQLHSGVEQTRNVLPRVIDALRRRNLVFDVLR